jgi:hypothetical protein
LSIAEALKIVKFAIYLVVLGILIVLGLIFLNNLIEKTLDISGLLPKVADFITLLGATPGPLTFALSLNFAIEIVGLSILVFDKTFDEVIRAAKWLGGRMGWISKERRLSRTQGSFGNDLALVILMGIACILVIGYVYE